MEKKNFLEEKLLPIATKLSQNRALNAVRDGVMLSMPLLIIGSLFMIIASLPIDSLVNWLTEQGIADYLWKGVNSSFGLVALVASFGIAHSMARSYQVDGVGAGIVSLSTFIVVTPFVAAETGEGLTISYLGANGIFVAIVLGLINGWVYSWFIRKDIQITLPDSVPPAVARSFSAVIPGAILITFWLIVFSVLNKFGLPNVHDIVKTVLAKPLGLLAGTLIGTMLVTGLNSIFWFLGIHGGSTINQIFSPVWLANLDVNAKAMQAGQPLQHIFTSSFMDNFVYLGGGGATLGLVLVISFFAFRKYSSLQTKTMAPLTLTPGIFNINEPAMFGLPIVMNFTLLIPFVLTPMVNTLISYLAFSSGIVPLTYASATWTMPPILSGFLTTGSIMGSVLQVVLIVIDVLIYFPFYMAVERNNKILEGSQTVRPEK